VTADASIAALRSRLVATAGGYLRNLVTDGTCQRCYTPIDSAATKCSRCRRDDADNVASGLPDARGFMTYASHHEPIAQSGRLMWDYKSPIQPSASAQRTITLLAALALRGHRDCPRALLATAPTAWAAVPSLPAKDPDDHRLARILRSLARPNSTEISLRGVGNPESPRDLRAAHFAVLSPIPRRTHVLLVEDTWASGGHAQSAALALRAAGAEHISLLTLARWLTPEWGATTATWMKTTLSGMDYNPNICPWTQAACPT
jgi:hypothetical protein